MCRREEWEAAKVKGIYSGSSQDKADGFIHFSASDQIIKSAARHRTGQDGLVLISIDAALLGEALKWEPARGGELFPHLYGDLPLSAVLKELDLKLGPDGTHIFPKFEFTP